MNQPTPHPRDPSPAARATAWTWWIGPIFAVVAIGIAIIWYVLAPTPAADTSLAARLNRLEQQQLTGAAQYATLHTQVSDLHARLGQHDRDWARRIDLLDQAISAQQDVIDARLMATEQRRAHDRTDARTQLDALTDSLTKVHTQLGRGLTDWSLAEVEQLLTIANHRLIFSGDTVLAQAALQLAQQRLATLSRPQLLPVREGVAAAVAELAARPPLDKASGLSQLHALANEIKYLPLQTDARLRAPVAVAPATELAEPTEPVAPSEPQSETAARGYWQSLLAAVTELLTNLGDMIQVEKNATSLKPLILAEVRWLTHEKGRLLLESAQLALLQQEAAVFDNRMTVARAWFLQHFAQDSARAQTWLAQFDQIRVTVADALLDPTEIDLSAARRALRVVIEKQQP